MDKGIKLQKELAMGLPGAAAEATGKLKSGPKGVTNLKKGGIYKDEMKKGGMNKKEKK